MTRGPAVSRYYSGGGSRAFVVPVNQARWIYWDCKHQNITAALTKLSTDQKYCAAQKYAQNISTSEGLERRFPNEGFVKL